MNGRLIEQLPRVMAEDDVLRRFLGIFEELSAETETRIDHLDGYFSVDTAPIEFVRWVGGWLGMAVDSSLPEDRQRALVRTAGRLIGSRGTPRALGDLLSALTSSVVQVRDRGGVFEAGQAPASSRRVSIRVQRLGHLDHDALMHFIAQEVPADAIVDVTIDPSMVPPVPTPPTPPTPRPGRPSPARGTRDPDREQTAEIRAEAPTEVIQVVEPTREIRVDPQAGS
ncbi:MAG: phage tail protein [Actinomycetota bacterium]|nr:phage tail protein [Actinomycetota bacterium]